MTHTEESLMSLADEQQIGSYSHAKRLALRLAIREVLAERDEARTQRLNTYRDLNAVGRKLREVEAECERLRKDAERWNTALANCEVYGPRGVISTVQEFDATFDTAIAQEKSK